MFWEYCVFVSCGVVCRSPMETLRNFYGNYQTSDDQNDEQGFYDRASGLPWKWQLGGKPSPRPDQQLKPTLRTRASAFHDHVIWHLLEAYLVLFGPYLCRNFIRRTSSKLRQHFVGRTPYLRRHFIGRTVEIHK